MSNCTTTLQSMKFRNRYVYEFTVTSAEILAAETQNLRDEFVGTTLPAGSYGGAWVDHDTASQWECYDARAVSEFGDPTLPRNTDYVPDTTTVADIRTPNPSNCAVCSDGYNYAIDPSTVPWVPGGFVYTGNDGEGNVAVEGELYCQHVVRNEEIVVKVLRFLDVPYREVLQGQNRTLVSTANCPCVYS